MDGLKIIKLYWTYYVQYNLIIFNPSHLPRHPHSHRIQCPYKGMSLHATNTNTTELTRKLTIVIIMHRPYTNIRPTADQFTS